jgi:phage terminase small subunit
MALSPKQQIFVAEYLKCWSATEAALKAGYKAANRQRASEIGYQLLQKTPVSEEIERRKAELMMSADEALTRLTEQARAEYSKYFNDKGAVNLSQMMADGKGHLVKKIKPTSNGDEVEFYDAQTALLNIGKHHGLFPDKVEFVQRELNTALDLLEQHLEPEAFDLVLSVLARNSR